jgi:hypothetical protein
LRSPFFAVKRHWRILRSRTRITNCVLQSTKKTFPVSAAS